MTREEFIKQWEFRNPEYEGRAVRMIFIDELRHVSGCGLEQCIEAARIEDYDPQLCLDRLQGNRPEEWRMKYEELEQRLRLLESIVLSEEEG